MDPWTIPVHLLQSSRAHTVLLLLVVSINVNPRYPKTITNTKIAGRRRSIQDATVPMNGKVRPAPQPMIARVPDPNLVPWPTIERCFEVTEEEMKSEYGYMDWYKVEVRYLWRNTIITIGDSGEKDLANIAERFGD